MGLRMDDLHAPTVPSGPSSQNASNGVKSKKQLQELIKEKENLEAELSALGSVLDSHGVNMNTSLTTFDGYPRADIDVAQIRTTRARIIRLKNDHKELMGQLEEAVHERFSKANASSEQDAIGTSPQTRPNTTPRFPPSIQSATATSPIDAPFARVNSVTPGSPAEQSGMKAGDRVTRFGYVDWTNHERLSKVAQVVQQNENREILVKVLREATALELFLTPRRDSRWRGLLGCHLLPV